MSNAKTLMDDDKTTDTSKKAGDLSKTYVNTLGSYLRKIGFSPLLTAEEELILARRVQAGDKQARCKMIESNLRLVVKVAKRYVASNMDLLDLIEEGNIGLMHAVGKFDPSLGYRFSTYSIWWIRQAIERAIMNHNRLVRLPVHVIQGLQKYRKNITKLTEELGRGPTAQEVADIMQKPIHEIEAMANMDNGTFSLDEPLVKEDDGDTFVDTIIDENNIDPARQIQAETMVQLVDMWLGKLNVIQSEVIARRFGLRGHEKSTLEDISQIMEINREKVRQLQNSGLKKLRELLYQHGMLEEVLG